MRSLVLSPRWLALHAVAIVLVAAFVALGWWQLDAYRSSEARHDARDADPVPLADVIALDEPVGPAVDRPVTTEGSYISKLVVPARVKDGVLGGYAVGALDTGNGVLIVLRGWTATPDDAPPLPAGAVAVTGHLLASEPPERSSGRNLEADEIGYLAPDPVQATLGEHDFFDGYLLLTDEQPRAGEPLDRIEVDQIAPIRNVGPWQNLSYWAQWWVFAAAVIVFWLSFVRTGIKRTRQAPAQAPDDQREPSPPPCAPPRTTSAG